ncbi:hypothetical protein BDW71DRAFT_203349 [Aspergillus fruticulosus]
MSIHLLLPELLLTVTSNLESAKDTNAFGQASRHFCPVASDLLFLYRNKVQQDRYHQANARLWSLGGYSDEYGVTSLIYAAKPVIPSLKRAIHRTGALFEAAREGRNEMVKLLLDHGSDINHKREGELVVTMLEATIAGGHSSTVQPAPAGSLLRDRNAWLV